MDRILSDLNGADFNKRMVWHTDEGFDVKPFYRSEDTEQLYFNGSLPGHFPYVRGAKVSDNNWYIRQNIEVFDYAEANRKALDVLMKGIDSLCFVLTDPESVNNGNLKTLLQGIHIDAIELNFLCNGKAKEILECLTLICSEEAISPEKLKGAIETDPLGRLMLNGKLCVSVEDGFDYLSCLTTSASVFPHFRTIHHNASYYANAGAGIVQELAFAVSAGTEYMTQLMNRGLGAEQTASKIRFSFAIGSNYFWEIAKLKAGRLLWSTIQKGFQSGQNSSARMEVHCVTSEWNKTLYDPYVNMLRTQTEAMSAVLGGTDSLTVNPFDKIFRTPGDFSERIARNQQLILKDEAYFGKVADPAAGSYYIENLTYMIADRAWKLFLDIEDKGGFLSCLKSGFIQKHLSGSATQKRKDISTKRIKLLGANLYPNHHERISGSLNQDILFKEIVFEEDLLIEPVRLFRGAEEYEKMRISVDMASYRPVVFLLPVGNPVMRKARSQFSADFFSCAGYYIIDNPGFDTVAEGVEKAKKCNANIVVICSSDEEYSKFVPEIFQELKEGALLVIAGKPACMEELKALGIQHFIYAGIDVTCDPQVIQ